MAKSVKLNLIVDKSCNRVIFAESGRDFVDILFSFLTLPLGSILRLTKQSIGSINNLLESAQKLNIECFRSEACRSMLLRPSNAAHDLFSSLPIKYDNISNLFHYYYTCGSGYLSFYTNTRNSFGMLMNKGLLFVAAATSSNAEYSSVFFNGAFKFAISDDLLVSQLSVEFAIEQLSKPGIKQGSCLESITVDVTAAKIIELLKQLLVSDTPLTDVFLSCHKEKDKLQDIRQPLRPKCEETEEPTETTRKISMKLFVNKDEDKAFIAEADNDFADLLFGFLTYTMGSIIRKFRGKSGIRCMDNLYNSVEALKPANCFRNNELIEKLLNPKLPPYFKVRNQLINLHEVAQAQSYFTCSGLNCQTSKIVYSDSQYACKECGKTKVRHLYLTDPKRGTGADDHITGGYMRISRYMITDDLVLREPSAFMVIAEILKAAAGKEIHAKNVEIGEREALAILRASITSENVLSDALLGEKRGKHRYRSY